MEENPQNWGALWFRALGTASVADPQGRPFPRMFHHVKFGRSASKGVDRNRMEPSKLGSAGAPADPCGGVSYDS